MTFPLFKLPDVAYENVLAQVDTRELIYLSACSRNTYKILTRPSSPWKSVEIFIFLEQYGLLEFMTVIQEDDEDPDPFFAILHTSIEPWIKYPIGIMGNMKFRFDKNKVYIQNKKGFQTAFSHIIQLFKTKNVPIKVETNYKRKYFPILNFLPKKGCDFLVKDRKYIKFFELLNLDKEIITMNCCFFADRYVNHFLHHWTNGGSPNMKYAAFVIRRNHDDRIFNGIVYRRVCRNRYRKWKLNSDESLGIKKICGGQDIARRDGTEATIIFYERDAETLMEMFVWNDIQEPQTEDVKFNAPQVWFYKKQ